MTTTGGGVGTFSELVQHSIDPAARGLLDLAFCLEYLVVPLGAPPAAGAPIQVGMVRTDDLALRGELERRLELPVVPVQLNAWEVRHALSTLHGEAQPAPRLELQLSAGRTIAFDPERGAPQLVDDLLSVAVSRGASDVHIEVYAEDVDVRLRIDGFLRQLTTPISPGNVRHVISRLEVLCGLDVLERRRAQSGHLSGVYRDASGAARRVDFRVSLVPGPYGVDATIRVLDPRRFRLDLDALGMPAPIRTRFERLIAAPHGLLLVAGPTLSGKTNTLYAAITALRARERKVMTVEDPIELELPKVNQKQVSAEMGYAEHVREFVRHNPDVLLVGEVRDAGTAEAVVQAATTGHLVLSSIHTRSAATAITRLRTLGVLDEFIASTLIGVVGQRLVPRICDACRVRRAATPELARTWFPAGDAPVWAGAGCERCEGAGFRGVTGLFELLGLDDEVAAEVERGSGARQVQAVAAARGLHHPLLDDALEKLRRGLVTLEEVSARLLTPFAPEWQGR